MDNEIQGRVKKVVLTPKTAALLSAFKKELGLSLNAHVELVNVLKRVKPELRGTFKQEFKNFKNAGLIRKHRSNTWSWTSEGREAARRL